MTEPLKVTIELDLDRALRGVPIYDEGGDIVDSGQTTLEDVVLDRVAHLVLAEFARDDAYGALRSRIQSIRDEVIRDEVRPRIVETLDKAITLTNTYGEPNGQTTTLREVIVDRAMAWLTKPQGSFDRKKSPLDEVIAAEVDKAMKAEMVDALSDAKRQALEAVRAKGAEFLESAVAGMVKS